ncbi:Hypothetical protein D9617_21g096730 [Elsinoe fawcettii]|nr:Hypothetical protein D9617_21g096730 [Elsinoe fawcettii]
MALSTDRSIFQVAIMCALPLEADAVIAALDKVESNTAQKYGAAQEDSNSYTIGEMSGHPVVVVHFEGMGKVAAAKATANANHSFPNLKLVLLAGICGGVPVTPDGKQIYIGDLILSTSIKQYDFGRQLVGRFEAKRGADAINPRPLEGVRSLLKMLDTTHHRKTLQEDINATMDLLARQSTCYAWPDSDGRSYFPSHHHHKHSVVTTTADPCDCQTGGVCDIACKTSCVDLKCDSASMVVRCETCRSSRSTCRHDAQIMFGIVGTGDTVFKSGTHRDQESKSHNLIAFAMEAAGPWEYLPTIVVKAVCDYADGHKIKEWQHYAAGIAAAGVKAILKHWRRSEIPGQTQTSTPRKAIAVWPAVRKLNPHFTGRTEVLQNIKDIFLAHLHNPEPESLCCIVVAGLGGQGKSEICLHTALSMTKYFAGIFWVDVSSSEQALKGFERVASALGKDASDLQSYRDALDNWQERWLLILDNADELAEDYQGYMPCSSEGSVLISTRNSKCFCYASSSECAIELDGLADAEAELLLLRSTGQTGVVPEHVMLDVRMVNQLLTGHTLALLQAGALVRTGYCTLAEYPARYSEKKKDLMEYHPAQARSRHNDVYTTFEVSAVQLTKDAEDLLCMLAVLTCDPMPLHCFEIVRRAATEIIQGKLEYPDDVRNLTTQHTRRLIHSLGFERAETAM